MFSTTVRSENSNVRETSERNAYAKRLFRVAPGLAALWPYEPRNLPFDLRAGLSVAAVAVPVGVAYAELAGFNPVMGLYSSILPLAAYAVFGTSRQLIIGPDAATCALVAAAVTPLAAGDQLLYASLSVSLAFLAGLFCIGARFLRLGALADFLSKPILVGFLNGIALSVIFGQLGKVFGTSIKACGIVPELIEFGSKLGLTHWPSLAVGLGTFLVLFVAPRWLKKVPAALLAMVLAAFAVRLFGLEQLGVKIIGHVPAGLPPIRAPHFSLDLTATLFADAAGLALVTFCSMMLTSRSFASKNGYDVDADQEFAALGAANIVSALSQGFAVSGADSRTAMSDTCGGRTQATGLVAAATITVILLFFTGPLRYVPIPALGAVLIKAGFSLIDTDALKLIYKIDRKEFVLSFLTVLGVIAVGAIHAILLAVALAILQFVRLTARPKVEILGRIQGVPGFHSVERHQGAATTPGLLLFRFNAPIVFFNAPHFKRQLIAAVNAAGPELKWVVVDLLPVTLIDATGLYTTYELAEELENRGVVLAAAGRQTEWHDWTEARRSLPRSAQLFPTLRAALESYLTRREA